MKSFLQKVVPVIAFMIVVIGIAQPVQMAGIGESHALGSTSRATLSNNDETEAVGVLTKLGVPLQRDSRNYVRWIEATMGELSDESMRYLPRLSRLEWLEIGGGKVTPKELTHLKDCTALKRLYIHDINLEGEDLPWLSKLISLEALSLQRTGIEGRVLKNIKAINTLTVLNISGNKIYNQDMDSIARMKGLEVLALADTKITGIGLAKLEGMQKLNELNLMNCNVHDSDLESFLSMPNLRIVYAEGCNFTDMAIECMKSRFSMLAIFR